MQQAGQISAEKHESPEKLALVEKVKNVQKSGHMARQLWYDYCSSHGNTNFDPARHDEAYLRGFMEKMEQGGHGSVGSLEANKVYVGNLERNVTEDDVKEFFSNFGTVTLVELKMDITTGLSRGFAFVSFIDEAPVKFILENKEMMKIAGKQIEVKPARDRSSSMKGGGGGGWGDDYGWMQPPTKGKGFGKMAMMMSAMAAMMKGGKGGKGAGKPMGPTYGAKGAGNPTADSEVIFVGGLPRDATEEAIAAHFSQWGTVQKVDMKYDQTTYQFRGFAFVTLGSPAEAQAIFNNYDNNLYNGKWIDCKPAALGKMGQMSGDPMAVSVPPTIPTDKVAPPPTGTTLRARGLPFSATKDQVLEFFSGYGVTGRVHMKQDYMGRPSGEVFVEFISTEEAVRAFNDRNFQMMGTRYVELIGASDADVKLYLDNGGKGATAGYGPMKGKGGKGPSPYDFMAYFGGY